MSIYKYQMNNLVFAAVQDENLYLISKSENKLPSDITTNSVDENIELLLNM